MNIQKIVAETIRSLVNHGYVPRENDQDLKALEIAKEIENCNLIDQICCPMCEEVQCDGDCPLEDIRENLRKQGKI